MFEYKIKLPYRVQDCVSCPFRRENVIHEMVNSMDTMSGVMTIIRKVSICMLQDMTLTNNIVVDAYRNTCPLKDNVTQILEGK